MCFSATASFIAGGSLVIIGVATMRLAGGRQRRFDLAFAAMPLLFAIQQIVEGVLWLSIQYDQVWMKALSTYLFTFFSHLLWPVYVPYAIARLESGSDRMVEAWRYRAMLGCRVAGMVTAVLLLVLVATQPLAAVENVHIIYVTPFFYDWPVMVLYIVATCIVAFFSSHGLVRLFGLMVLLFFFVSYWFYTEAFFSVWCFFAAILSTMIYLHFRRVHDASVIS